MITSVEEIQESLQQILKKHLGDLKIRHDHETSFEVCGTKEAMQGKQKVDGFYFASVMPKPKDCRLYFFPIYTHVESFKLSDDLRKYLKGKSCFHIKKLSPEIKEEIETMIARGIDLYKKDGLI
jgi:hypothetical protein